MPTRPEGAAGSPGDSRRAAMRNGTSIALAVLFLLILGAAVIQLGAASR